MKRKAVESARVEFNRAREAMKALATSNNFDEIARHWAAFLVAAARIFTKLEQGSKDFQKSRAWWSTKIHQRRNDSLLRYLWHARNADEHTIEAVTLTHLARIMHHAGRFCTSGRRSRAGDPSVWIGVRQLAVQHVWD
jgi:hypothetical protein